MYLNYSKSNKHRCAQTRRKDSVTTGDRCNHWLFTLLLTIHLLVYPCMVKLSLYPFSLIGQLVSTHTLPVHPDWSVIPWWNSNKNSDWSVFLFCSLIGPSRTTCSPIGPSTLPALWLVHLDLPALWLVSLHNLLSDWSMKKATDSPTHTHTHWHPLS